MKKIKSKHVTKYLLGTQKGRIRPARHISDMQARLTERCVCRVCGGWFTRLCPNPNCKNDYTKDKTPNRPEITIQWKPEQIDQLKADLNKKSHLPGQGKNLFLDRTQKTVHKFNVTNCWVFRGALVNKRRL